MLFFFFCGRFAQKRLKHMEKALSMAPKDKSSMTPLAKREVIAIKKEQENKVKHLFFPN